MEALTSSEIKFQHLDSRELKCSWDSSVVFAPGSVIKIRGQGMPILGRFGDYGDLYVHVNINFPSKISEYQKNLLIKAFGQPPPPPPLHLRDDAAKQEPIFIDNPKILPEMGHNKRKDQKYDQFSQEEGKVDCATQ